MSMSIGGVNAGYSLTTQTSAAGGGQGARPTFAHNHTWASIGDMENAWRSYTQEWSSYYSNAFAGSGAEGDGKITQEELSELLEAEFGGMGVKFTDGAVDESNPKAGTFEVYIDDATRRKMADDSDYRAKVMAVIQSEMAGTGGYSVQVSGNVVNDRTTGLSMNMEEGGPIYEGVPHSAGGTGTGGMTYTSSETGGKKKSMLEQILERLEEKLEEKKEAEKKEEAKKAREDLLEISVEAKARIAALAAEKAAGAEETEAADDSGESDALGNNVNVLA